MADFQARTSPRLASFFLIQVWLLQGWSSHVNCHVGTSAKSISSSDDGDDDEDGVAPLTTVVVFENRGGANTLCVCRLCCH